MGEAVRPGLDQLECLKDLLGEAALLADTAQPRDVRAALSGMLREASTTLSAACGLLHAAVQEDSMKRRDMLGLWPLAVPTLLDRRIALPVRSTHPTSVDEELARLTALASGYDVERVADLAVQVGGQGLRIEHLMDAPMAVSLRHRAIGLVGENLAFRGWLSFAANAHHAAQRHFIAATEAAIEAEDLTLHAAVLASRAETIASTHPTTARPGNLGMALDWIEQAVRIVPPTADPYLRSWIYARYAVLSAANGNGGIFFDAIERASELLNEPAEPGQGFFSRAGRFATWGPSMIAEYRGVGLMHLHRAASAEQALQEGLTVLHNRHQRRRTNLFAAIGASYLAQSEPELAADYASSAVLVAKNIYPLGVHRIKVLRGRLEPYRELDAVRNLDEHLLAA